MTNATHELALNGNTGCLSRAYFCVDGDRVTVKAMLGAAYYIDQTYDRATAREVWKDLVAKGYRVVEYDNKRHRQTTALMYS
jgi:tRNA G18 (ribose-2'-O)-methylase SpoU